MSRRCAAHRAPAAPSLIAEQDDRFAHRLRRHRAGRRLDYDEITPDLLAETIAAEIGCPVDYRPVAADGAARAASLLAELL